MLAAGAAHRFIGQPCGHTSYRTWAIACLGRVAGLCRSTSSPPGVRTSESSLTSEAVLIRVSAVARLTDDRS
jgi:hypothetical protein